MEGEGGGGGGGRENTFVHRENTILKTPNQFIWKIYDRDQQHTWRFSDTDNRYLLHVSVSE